MARKFYRGETVPSTPAITTKLGAQSAPYKDTELGKFVKMSTSVDSDFVLCAAGDAIEGYITGVEAATSDGYGIGSVQEEDSKTVTFDGLQATAGTGTIALGDYVVCGTVVAKDTALTAPAKVCKATNQPGTAVVSTVGSADTAAAIKTQIDAALVKVADAEKNSIYAWRVVSLGTAGTGAVGTVGVIARVN